MLDVPRDSVRYNNSLEPTRCINDYKVLVSDYTVMGQHFINYWCSCFVLLDGYAYLMYNMVYLFGRLTLCTIRRRYAFKMHSHYTEKPIDCKSAIIFQSIPDTSKSFCSVNMVNIVIKHVVVENMYSCTKHFNHIFFNVFLVAQITLVCFLSSGFLTSKLKVASSYFPSLTRIFNVPFRSVFPVGANVWAGSCGPFY